MEKYNKCNKQFHTENYKISSRLRNLLLVPLFIGLIIIIINLFFFNMNSNPLIGKWSPEQTTIMGMKLEEVEFTTDKMIIMGIESKVDYELNGNKVFVIDEEGIIMPFKIINDKTMNSEMISILGFKHKYRKV